MTSDPVELDHDPREVHVYTDGSCSGNPGPGGWGALITKGVHQKEISGGEHDSTNNRMELMAAIEALRAIKPGTELYLHTDSSYVKDGLTKWIHGWKRNGWKTAAKKPVKNVDLWQALDDIAGKHTVHWRWVKGHAGDPGNERADDLAVNAMQKIKAEKKSAKRS